MDQSEHPRLNVRANFDLEEKSQQKTNTYEYNDQNIWLHGQQQKRCFEKKKQPKQRLKTRREEAKIQKKNTALILLHRYAIYR